MLLCFLLVAMSLGSEPEQQTHSCEHGGDGVSLLSFRSMKGGRADTFNSSAGQGGEIDIGVDQEAEALEMLMDYEQLYAEAVGMVPEELTKACKSMDRNSDGEITEEDFQQAPKDAWPAFQKAFNGQNVVVTMAECISGETKMYLDRLDEVVAEKNDKSSSQTPRYSHERPSCGRRFISNPPRGQDARRLNSDPLKGGGGQTSV